MSKTEAQILKGVARISGDGWKDKTREGDVVYVWNRELPPPYALGEYLRVGNDVWAAGTNVFDFAPAPQEEVEAVWAEMLTKHGVKKLKWSLTEWSGVWRAEASFGDEYSVWPISSHWRVFLEGELLKDGLLGSDEAKAYAQADYERRILSALEDADG